jgi:excisionase family DNA binding protein
MSSKWVTVDEAAAILKVSTSTVRRRVENEKIESKLEDGRRLVRVADDTQMSSKDEQLLAELRIQNEHLRNQVAEKDKQMEALQEQLSEASRRHDTVVMQMTRIVEYQQQPLWRKLFQRKQLPPPIDETIIDVETGREKEANGQ